jgi:hypothetical protein
VKIKIDFKCPGIEQNLKAIRKWYSCPNEVRKLKYGRMRLKVSAHAAEA